MSYFKRKDAIGALEISGFEGIDRSSQVVPKKCEDMVNLRILSDGSIIKRDGFREEYDFLDPIRGIMSAQMNDGFFAYVVAGNSVYKYNFDTNTAIRINGNISTDTGEVSVFFFLGRVYIVDGVNIYEVKDEGIEISEGYVPLLGRDWGSNYPGEIYEPLNLFSPNARITYVVDDPPTMFLPTLYEVDWVDALYLNGEQLDSTRYTINSRFKTIDVPGLEAGDRVKVYLSFVRPASERKNLLSNTRGEVFGGINNSRLFLWGGNNKNRIYAASPVTDEALNESREWYRDSGPLYFPIDHSFYAGDGKNEITALSRHYDRLLIFTAADVWMADGELSFTKEFPLMRVNTDVGCSATGGVAKCKNDPISIGRGRIFRWTSNTDTLEDCNAYPISTPIEDMLDEEFFQTVRLHTDKYCGEVLFSYKRRDTRGVLVYGVSTGAWYRYEGISADIFFDAKESVGFVNGSRLCIFKKGLQNDIDINLIPSDINASCVLLPSDLGLPERKKKIGELFGLADLSGGVLELSFESESGIKNKAEFKGGDKAFLESFYKRFRTERFLRTKIKISLDPKVNQRVYSLTVTARP